MELDLSELERRAKAATPGKWTWKQVGSFNTPGCAVFWPDTSKGGVHYRRLDSGGGMLEADANFIAAANPAVVLELVRRLRAAERWQDAVIDQLDVMHITSARHKDDPVFAVHDCMAYSANLALDPAVSEQALALIEAEREACAQVCEAQLETGAHRRCAAAIRARNQPPKNGGGNAVPTATPD